MKTRKKLIEVALPLEAINLASAREKDVKVGKPNNLHLWWAPRPHAAARAIIFSQMVDDPSACPDLFPNEKAQQKERKRLFRIIEDLVQWENITNERVIQAARAEIWQSWRRVCADNVDHPRAKELFDRQVLPAFHDPFAGGGALPMEAQRLGLASYASDLNPVAVLVNKAKIEFPARILGGKPVNPAARQNSTLLQERWAGLSGLADDLRFYGNWIRDRADSQISHLYPSVEVTTEMVKERPDLKPYDGQKLTVIAWIWARTVKSPNPAFANVDVPLASTFMLSTKPGKEVYVEPLILNGNYEFIVRTGKPSDMESAQRGTSAGKRSGFSCIMSGTPITYNYIRDQGSKGLMGTKLMAIVGEGRRGRVYLSASEAHEQLAKAVDSPWHPEAELQGKCRQNVSNYGINNYGDLFTPRQLLALTTFSDLVSDARNQIEHDAVAAGMLSDGRSLHDGGQGAKAYAEMISVYLALAISRSADWTNTITRWLPHLDKAQQMFSRHAIPMAWDFTEINPLTAVGGSVLASVKNIISSFERLPTSMTSPVQGYALQLDASRQNISMNKVISTDPPYYDNIGYADLSDFFYVWLRRAVRPIFPTLFGTMHVPKTEELVASPSRHGSKEQAQTFFMKGMTLAMQKLAEQANPAFPVTIYYACKQSESDSETGTTNTGWDTFLAAAIDAGFSISGTWPIRTEKTSRTISVGKNALASSIVLVCNKRPDSAMTATRREFLAALRQELPQALANLQAGNIAPVDLAQAAIGPGMAVFTRYSKVIDAEGNPISVREALALINQTLDEALAEQEGDFDADSRWALAWFEQHGFAEGEFGVADVLARAKNTAVSGLVEAGILVSSRGKVRLLKPDELPVDWDPATDSRLTSWEVVHHLIRVLETGGEAGAAKLMAALGAKAEAARDLCYRLYSLCERKKRANEALAYNGLVQSWPEISRLSREQEQVVEATQASLF
jgi:putative DNA methylase